MGLLLYVDEHLGCSRYSNANNSIFACFDIKGDCKPLFRRIVNQDLVFFVLKGKVNVNVSSGTEYSLREDEFVLIPKSSAIAYKVEEDCRILTCSFWGTSSRTSLCNKYSIEELERFISGNLHDKLRSCVMKANVRMKAYLNLLYDCLSDGLGCVHYHENKLEEMFFILRAYYEKDKLAEFFYPLLCATPSFKEEVISRYEQFDSIKDFAYHMNMSEATFLRHFKREFKVTPYKWLEERKAERLSREIMYSQRSFEEISEDFRFSSPSYMTAFCKKHFGLTPTDLRNKRDMEIQEECM